MSQKSGFERFAEWYRRIHEGYYTDTADSEPRLVTAYPLRREYARRT